MAFRQAAFTESIKFNSASSCDLIKLYKNAVIKSIKDDSARKPSCTIAPSSIRCARKQWFRLRNTDPDVLELPDLALAYKASIGTDRHKYIQSVLKSALGEDWIDVSEYLKANPISFDYTLTKSNYETLVQIADPPVRFACDGIIRLNGKIYLLEIKTSEYSSWVSLTKEKDIHRDQILSYCALLGIHNVLFVYEERMNGEWKCFEHNFTDSECRSVLNGIYDIQDYVRDNIAPPALQIGDYMCKNCEYKLKCKEW